MREWSDWCQPHYVADPHHFLSFTVDEFLRAQNGASDAAPRLCLLEDADEVLDKTRGNNDDLHALLNLTDGIFTDLGVVFVVTTNLKRGLIHPAALRSGRCLALNAFTSFNPTESAAWARRHDPSTPRLTTTTATLAQLYALEEGRSDRPGGGDGEEPPIGQYL